MAAAPIDIEALRAELVDDPAGLGYAGKTPDQIRTILATVTVSVECFVPLRDLQSLLMETVVAPAPVPAWWVLKGAAKTNPLAEMAFDLFSSRLEHLNTRGAFQASALAQLQAAGLIDQPLRDKVDAMAVKQVPRGEHLFGRVPSALEVEVALMPA